MQRRKLMSKNKEVPSSPAEPETVPVPSLAAPAMTIPLVPSEVVRQAINRRISLKEALPDDEDFKARWPFLWQWLTFTDLSEVAEKERATLIAKVTEGAWLVSISDASMAASLAATSGSLFGALERLDDLLGDPDAPWVPRRGKAAKVKPRKPK
jgi:hypothetical protein